MVSLLAFLFSKEVKIFIFVMSLMQRGQGRLRDTAVVQRAQLTMDRVENLRYFTFVFLGRSFSFAFFSLLCPFLIR